MKCRSCSIDQHFKKLVSHMEAQMAFVLCLMEGYLFHLFLAALEHREDLRCSPVCVVTQDMPGTSGPLRAAFPTAVVPSGCCRNHPAAQGLIDNTHLFLTVLVAGVKVTCRRTQHLASPLFPVHSQPPLGSVLTW